MIAISELSLHFADRSIFDNIGLLIKKTDKIGLVGKNGAGKSTFLKLLQGMYQPDGGTINIQKSVSLGYLPQEMKHNENVTIREEAQNANQEIVQVRAKIDDITVQLETRTDYESSSYLQLIEDLNEANERFQIIGGYNQAENAERILFGLGFKPSDLDRPMSEFSGGWKMRVELAKILLQNPDVLLLDEPTNHLDIESIQWLEDFLKRSSSAILLISHDRLFLDNITNRTIEIINGKLRDYPYPYTKYKEQREIELIQQFEAAKNQDKYIEHTQELINKFRAKKNKAAFAQSLIRKLEKLDKVEVESDEVASLNIKFPPAPRSGKVVVEGKLVGKQYDKSIFSDADFIVNKGEKIALIGKNGLGKSTLVKMIVNQTDYDGEIVLGHNVDLGYFAQNETDMLDVDKTVFETIDDVAVGEIRKKVRQILGGFLFSGDDADKKVKVLSGGEKTRLAFCKLLLEPYNFLVLDEPTNHLDIQSKEILKQALQEFDGTMLLVSHDRDFLDGLTDRVFEIKDEQVSIHHFSVPEFLSRKKSKSIAELEQNKKDKETKAKKKSTNKDEYLAKKEKDKAERKYKNQISKCEKEIEILESRIGELNLIVEDLDYSDKEKTEQVLGEYQKAKSDLDKQYQLWEEASQGLDSLH